MLIWLMMVLLILTAHDMEFEWPQIPGRDTIKKIKNYNPCKLLYIGRRECNDLEKYET